MRAGHPTGVHVLVQYGELALGDTVPWKPALHVQPIMTLVPVLLAGQGTGAHVLVKYGAVSVAVTVPL